jgi:glycyl-tRNA synthetase
MYGVDAAILMNPKVWEASGHVSGFSDPLVECEKCKRRFRADHLENKHECPECGGALGEAKQFNMMFKTHAGAAEDESAVVYLRPETAGGIFMNYKNVVDALHPKLPFGIVQIGKAFRNEIAPRDFIFRLRELSQMEVEYFVKPSEWEAAFENWRKTMHAYAEAVGLPNEQVHELEVSDGDRAHYSKRTIDFEFDYPFGRKELWGLAYRTDFDLKAHQEGSGASLEYLDEETKEKFVPHVIEPSLGVDRTVLAILASAYREDELGGEVRTYLALSPKVAPVKAMVSPLLKNKLELVEKAKEVRRELQKIHPSIAWDDNGNIGKRYRRQDEIGTPFCITIDFDTLGETPELKDTVTLRHRDSGEQERLTVAEVAERIRTAIA